MAALAARWQAETRLRCELAPSPLPFCPIAHPKLTLSQKLFMKLFRHGNESRDEHKYIDQSYETFLSWTARTVVGLFCIVTVAVPVGVLLLVPPSDLDAFFLVLFCSIFVLLVVIARIRNFATAFVAFSTYTAILVTSLSNLYQAQTH